jgi:hypothetical protein
MRDARTQLRIIRNADAHRNVSKALDDAKFGSDIPRAFSPSKLT